MIDAVASDYEDTIEFLTVAGRSDLEPTTQRADELLPSGIVAWGLDESVWDLYGIRGQPASVIISQGVIVDSWFGALGEDELRARLDAVATS